MVVTAQTGGGRILVTPAGVDARFMPTASQMPSLLHFSIEGSSSTRLSRPTGRKEEG